MENRCLKCPYMEIKGTLHFCALHTKSVNITNGKTLEDYGQLLLGCKGEKCK